MVFIIFCPFFLKFSLHNSEDMDFPPPFFYFLGNIFLPSFILSLTGFIVGSFRSPLGTRDMHLLGLLYLPSMSGIFSLIPCPCILFSTSLCDFLCVPSSLSVPCHYVLWLLGTHSGILAWKISWTEEPGRLQSMGL